MRDSDETIPQEDGDYIAEIGMESDDSAYVENYDPFRSIRELIEKGELEEAQKLLEEFDDRDAEWYYVQACLFRKKSWFSECKKCLRKAIHMDPENDTYRAELNDLSQIAEKVRHANDEMGKKKQMGWDSYGFCGECCCELCGMGCMQCICEGLCEGCS